MLTTVPVIDLAPFREGAPAGKAEVAAQVARACEDLGFFTIAGHGVPADLVARMAAVCREFFDLPLEDKLTARRPRPEQSRGYIGLGDENLSYSRGDRSTSDLKEFFAIGPVERDAWLAHMREAVDSLGLTPEQDATLWRYLEMAAHSMQNR